MNSEKEAELKALFASYDQNGDGHISAEELKSAFQKLGASISDDEINNMVNLIFFFISIVSIFLILKCINFFFV